MQKSFPRTALKQIYFRFNNFYIYSVDMKQFFFVGSHRCFRVRVTILVLSVQSTQRLSRRSRNGPLLWVKFDFTSSNKSLLLFVALRKLCRDSTKMNFKSSQNCRRVKLAALGERGWESCS